MGLADRLVYLDARRVSGSTVPNLGVGGSALNATIGGDTVAVDGPAVWFGRSGTANNRLSSARPYAANVDLYVEFTLTALADPGLSECSVFGDRSGSSCGAWVRFNDTNDGLIIARGDGTSLVQPTTTANVPAEVFSQETDWRLTIPTAGTPSAEYSLDGGASWVDLGASGWSTSFPESTSWVAGTLFGVGSGAGNYQERGLRGGLRRLLIQEVGGAVLFYLNAATDLDDVAATTITPTVGPTMTVVRSSTGPTTTIVPASRSLLINPDHTNAANKVTTPDVASLDIDADQDAVLMWCGVVGNQTGAFPFAVRVGPNPSGASGQFRLMRDDNTNTVLTRVFDGSNVSTEPSATVTPAELDVFAAWIDRTADLLRIYRIQADGTVTTSSVSIASVGALTFTEGITSLLSLPGAMSGLVYDVGGSYSAESIAADAAALLATYTGPPTRSRPLTTTRTNRKLTLV